MKIIIIIIMVFLNFQLFSTINDPIKFIENIIQKTKPALIEKNIIQLEKIMEENLDFNEIIILIIGKNIWESAIERQKLEFLNELKKLMLKTYTKTVCYYIDSDIVFLPIKNNNNLLNNQKRIQLNTVMKKNNRNVNIVFRLIRNNDSWLIFDVIIEGVSILKSLKAQLSEIIRIKGLDYTILKMKESNE